MCVTATSMVIPLYIIIHTKCARTSYPCPYLYRGLCPNTFPDEVCHSDFPLHIYDPPLLYDLNSDPGEIYNLNINEYAEVMATIEKVGFSW